ncbi:MAG: histidine phosphatase family protein [Microbacterium sp.]|uniref:histidine phosphatase family protein n=1 Tax=Microbacterium sp. TaxID=51671 RepID=UPI001AD455D7|nr:histidine phosphatase family protein [Microbacterium sp.]MBN9177319.1 histidine phosphatase family protein [Microbacterium sp.]
MTTLLLVRHGETDWNAARRIQGSTDIPLNETGRTQARATAAVLAERMLQQHGGARPLIVSSDLSRARETAQIIAAEFGTHVTRAYPQLRERSYGVAEGLTIDDYRARFGEFNRDNVPEAENDEALRARAVDAVRRVVRDARRHHAPADVPVIAVSHGAFIGQLIRHASAGELPLAGERLANASTHAFRVERDRLSVLSYMAVPVG